MRLTLPDYAIDGRDGITPMGPHVGQRRFHGARAQYKMYQAGFGGGKSHAGAAEFMRGVLRNAQGLNGRPGKSGLLYLVGAPDYYTIEIGAWRHLGVWLDEFARLNDWSLDTKRLTSHPRKIFLATGDEIRFVSFDRPRKPAGATAAGFWFDESELCDDPMACFKALQGRVRDSRAQYPFGIVTSTPRGNRGCAKHFRDRVQVGDPQYSLTHGSTRDNPGNLVGYADDLTSTMSERERLQDIEGQIVPDEGVVYAAEFSATASLADRWQWQADRSNRETYLMYDWGGHFSCVFVDHDVATGIDVVFDELHEDGCQTAEFIARVNERLRRVWGIDPKSDRLTAVYCDHEHLDDRKAAYKAYTGNVHSRRVRHNGDRESRIATVRWRLRAADGTRRLLFAPHLRKTKSTRGILACMENYSRAAKRMDGGKVVLDRVVQDSPYSHGADALGYGMWLRYSGERWHDENRAAP